MTAPRRVLIVDDDVEALRLIGIMLERQGYEILAAANGQQALQKAIEAQPDLLILDVMMPGMDGYDVARRIRSHPATDAIPILMFTAKADVNGKVAGFQAGADDYITKPIHPKDLISRVETLLERNSTASAEPELNHIAGFLPTKGGLGTSTLSLNTAIELSRMRPDISTALLELHEGNGTLALQLGWEPDARLTELLKRPLSSITEKNLQTQMLTHPSGLSLLLASPEPVCTGPELTKRHVRMILQYLSDTYDYVLLDLPANLGEPYREALNLCKSIILTIEPSKVGMALAQTMLASLSRFGITCQVQVVSLHRNPPWSELNRNVVEQMLHHQMIASIPAVPDMATESIENGRSMVEMQPHGLVTQQIRRVVQSILEV